METSRLLFLVVFAAGLVGCRETSLSGGTDTGNAGEAKLAAAVGLLFSGDEEAASLLARATRAQSDGDSMDSQSACETVENGEDAPSGVDMTLSVVAGTYGMTGSSVTLSESDGCDQGGEYAGFNVTSHDLSCSDGDGNQTTLTMQESSGVFRENLELSRTEIYGTFSLTDGTNAATGIRCSLTIDRNQRFGGGCEDASGIEIEQDSNTTCVDNE